MLKYILTVRVELADTELTFQKYEERIKSTEYEMQQYNPGNTPSSSEGESEGSVKLARACLKAQKRNRDGLEVYLDRHVLYQRVKSK